MSFLANRFIAFFCPHPNYFHLSPRELLATWDEILLVILTITMILYIIYYFFTYPDLFALKRFRNFNIIIIVFSVGYSLVTILNKAPSMLKEGAELDKMNLLWATIVSSFESTLIIIFIVYLLFMILAYSPGLNKISWQLKAMRRYPIVFKNIKREEK